MSSSFSQFAIQAIHLGKKFPSSEKPAVHDLNFEILAGESVAFLGPNGAGKSTTIKMLCGILTPDQGQALISGQAAGSPQANISLGLVFGARSQLYFHMTVIQCLKLQAEVYFVPSNDQLNRIHLLAEIFGAKALLHKRVRELSLGERMRCEIIASLIHKPKVILLDEPTIGLDIIAKRRLRESLKEWQKNENTTMLLTSHDLTDVEALCDRCILINQGQKAYDGRLQEAKGDLAGIRRVKLLLGEVTQLKASPLTGLTELSAESELEKYFEFDLNKISLTHVMDYFSETYGPYLQDIQIQGVRLEEVIQRHYGH
ncbi:MAG: putative ABC transporter, ATP-binding protein [Oligoflexia bacterium]|nr:MAG: putative ABC transporter, ATP-binding protein [Oligoflexia bacterium]